MVANNEISYNNYKNAYSATWEAGGTKFVKTTKLTVRGNHVHHNHGAGLWTDIDNIHTLYVKNLVEDNWRGGINHEVSYDAVIRNNTVKNNGHKGRKTWLWEAGIMVRGPNVKVYGNTVIGNKNGIGLIEQNRGDGALERMVALNAILRGDGASEKQKHGPYTVKNVEVYNNTVINSGRSGAVSDNGNKEVFKTSSFHGNTYKYNDTSAKWWDWNGKSGNWDYWQSQGQDKDGKLQKL